VTDMNHDQLLEKLGNAQVNLSPAMNDLMQRVREVGLHKVAAHTHGVSRFTIKTAAWYIGKELTRQHLKYSKIASGIRALQALDQSGEITLEKNAAPGAGLLKELGSAASHAMPHGMPPIPKSMPHGMPPIPSAAAKAPAATAAAKPMSAETGAAMRDIMPAGMGPSEARQAMKEMMQIGPPPGAGGGGLFSAPKGPSPFSGEVGQGLDMAKLRASNAANAPQAAASRSTLLRGMGGPKNATPAMEDKMMDMLMKAKAFG